MNENVEKTHTHTHPLCVSFLFHEKYKHTFVFTITLNKGLDKTGNFIIIKYEKYLEYIMGVIIRFFYKPVESLTFTLSNFTFTQCSGRSSVPV